ncbi:cupredoxin domain-containing protein [Brevibacillus sp. HB1.2]|uniref:cupredoxin domain-containing protein n=1 Tax=Brevibacillus sp. HB1.2 TaxID=2738807 RepID=UPI0020C71F9E|nr:cupredoxin domain-containing protein [Brevibacillus sp. HB1.2]
MIVNTDTRPHNLSIRDLNLTSTELKPTQSTLLQFSADKRGRYHFVSDAPGYPETGFQGMLVIDYLVADKMEQKVADPLLDILLHGLAFCLSTDWNKIQL